MKIIKPGYEIISEIDGLDMLMNIERAGRTCYKSEDRITDNSAVDFCRMIINSGHNSVIEHEKFSVRFVFDRGISHEMVRHRLASFSQESTRYCNYSKDKHGNEINVIDIEPHFKNKTSLDIWLSGIQAIEKVYFDLLANGETAQIARSILPNALKTEIVVTANLREWKLIFDQRCAMAAHPQIREVMKPLLNEVYKAIPVIFDDTFEKVIKEKLSKYDLKGKSIHIVHTPSFDWNTKLEKISNTKSNNTINLQISSNFYSIEEILDLQEPIIAIYSIDCNSDFFKIARIMPM